MFVTGTVGDQQVWQTTATGPYMYFNIPASLKADAGQPLYVAVQYYDTGYNRLMYQYDSTQGAFFPPEVTTHSSLVNTNTFATAYFEMRSPALQKQENGGNDFRIYSSNGPISIASVSIQTTPFADPTFQLALTQPWLTSYPGTADASTLQGKTMAGYQGWFSCPNDLNDAGWIHWTAGNATPFTLQDLYTSPGVDSEWPDVSAYPTNSLYPGARCKADQVVTQSGQQGYVFSSTNPDVVAQHFAWMQQYNIDGIFLQRFLGANSVPGSQPEWVLGNIRKSASQTGRLWAIEYDVSELTDSNVVATIENDWKWLNDSAHVRADGNYAHNNGKPVVFVWGLACRAGFTPGTSDTLIDFLKNDPTYGGNYVMGGICNQYQSMLTTWQEHFQRYNALLVWQPQNNSNDRALFTSWGIDWYPHVWAGHHLGGQEYWGDLYNAINAGADRFFIGMFDEYGENTAIIPTSDDPPTSNPPFLTNAGAPATWWLQLSTYGKQMMLKQIPLTPTMPSQ